MHMNYDVITFILKHLFVKKVRVDTFANIIKIATMLIKEIFKY